MVAALLQRILAYQTLVEWLKLVGIDPDDINRILSSAREELKKRRTFLARFGLLPNPLCNLEQEITIWSLHHSCSNGSREGSQINRGFLHENASLYVNADLRHYQNGRLQILSQNLEKLPELTGSVSFHGDLEPGSQA